MSAVPLVEVTEKISRVEVRSHRRGGLLHYVNKSDKKWQILSCILLVLVSAVSAATIRVYGITWDEEHHKEYGVVLLNWYSSLGHDTEALTKWSLYYYGGFADTLAQFFAQHVPYGVGVYEARHVVCLLFGLAGLAATYGLGRRIAGPRGGFFSALFLTLTPVYYGHMFNNPKDIPFAALFTLGLFSMLLAFDSLPYVPKKQLLFAGIAMGLAMGVRVNGMVLLACLGLLWGGWLLGHYWSRSLPVGQSLPMVAMGLGIRFVAVTVLAWGVMLACWPWALVSPILHPLEALQRTTDYDWPLTVFFDGKFVKASELPLRYLPTWFAISMPEFYFVALVVGGVLAFGFLRGFARTPSHIDRLLKTGLLVLVFSIPILAAIALRATIYDGLRQFLFIVPSLAVLAGVSVAKLLASKGMLVTKAVVVGVVMLSVGLTAFDMVDLHPYQYVYFNRLIGGGLETASTKYETDYYGASYREGVRWVIDNYHSASGEKVRVANPSMNFLTAYYLEASPELRDRFQPVQAWDNPDVFIATTRWNFNNDKQGTVVHVVSRKGVPLLYVIEPRPAG